VNHLKLGEQGEKLARAFLAGQGYRIVESNYRSPRGEIDIVCRLGRTVIFVEVKARTSTRFGCPAAAVNARKQFRLRRLAQEYLMARGLEPDEVRFDVLSVMMDAKPAAIEHLKGAF
jgi:putative endonuclease